MEVNIKLSESMKLTIWKDNHPLCSSEDEPHTKAVVHLLIQGGDLEAMFEMSHMDAYDLGSTLRNSRIAHMIISPSVRLEDGYGLHLPIRIGRGRLLLPIHIRQELAQGLVRVSLPSTWYDKA